MAIEGIQYKFDHIRVFRGALGPAINRILMWLQKEKQIETTKYESIQQIETTPQNMFN